MINRTHLALVLHDLGQLEEAEPEIRAALNFGTRALPEAGA
jgi:hypothetical protein